MVGDQSAGEMVQHQSVAADIPPRLQPDPGMGRPDPAHAIHIAGIELARGYARPVARLRPLGVSNAIFTAKESGDVREATDLIVEAIQSPRKRGLDGGPGGGERGLGLRIYAEEGQAVLKGDSVRHGTSRELRYRDV